MHSRYRRKLEAMNLPVVSFVTYVLPSVLVDFGANLVNVGIEFASFGNFDFSKNS